MSSMASYEDRRRLPVRAPQAPSHLNGLAKEEPGLGSLSIDRAAAPPWSTSGIPPWSTATRPLSDIRELTEPSLVDVTNRRPSMKRELSKKSTSSSVRTRKAALQRKISLKRHESVTDHSRPSQPATGIFEDDTRQARPSSSQSVSSPGDRSSIYSIPPGNVPPRSSSKQRSELHKRAVSSDLPTRKPSTSNIPNNGQSRSPVKEHAARLDPVTFETIRKLPSRTFVRSPTSVTILDAPSHKHPRISIDLHVSASLFVGGGSIEGHVRVNVDDAERLRHKRGIALGRMSVDLLGVEEMAGGKRFVFLNLGSELVDAHNPPPHNMVASLKQLSPIDPFWLLTPSISSIPFLLTLPLDVGPPPFQSKNARIRYVLCVSLVIRDQGRTCLVRSSQEVHVLSVYDPEKALMSLPSPLTASEDYVRHNDTSIQRIRLTAGLHRQVWVSGQDIFVDVHIANHSHKTIKRIELQLERNILCYKHAAAATLEQSASQARIFDNNDRSILNRTIYKQGAGNDWNGVPAHSTEVRTYDLELPRGHATVKCGKFFEVRYFLNILIGTSHTKLIAVQLPIVLIHMNSLDVVPNSVAQVAAAIEEKRTAVLESHLPHSLARQHSRARARQREPLRRRPSVGVQGRAFSAPRKQSLDRMRAEEEDLLQLGQILDSTPRRFATSNPGAAGHRRFLSTFEYHTPPSNRKGRLLYGEEYEEIQRRLRHIPSNETNRSAASISRCRSKVFHRLDSGASNMKAAATLAGGSGFRSAEVEDPDVMALGLRSTSSAAGSVRRKNRFEGARGRNFMFLGRSRSRSKNGWRGWFSGDVIKERKEKEAWI